MVSWHALERFRDARVPKLDNLRRAAAAGLRVPPTWWLDAGEVDPADPPGPPAELPAGAYILRSAAPTEDTHETSNAGQLLSLIVEDRQAHAGSLRRVVAALPPGGAVFVQPLVYGEEAGVAFFDGFYYERTQAGALNTALTGGAQRGEVTRGHLQRGEAWSAWLERVYAAFDLKRLDVEFARDEHGYVLLQARPALFPVRRNPLLTQANVQETLGDWPSPWTVSGVMEAARDRSFLTEVEPATALWDEALCVEIGERVWINLSLWFRWADHLGLPRTIPGDALGGVEAAPEDSRVYWRRLPRALVALVPGLWRALVKGRRAGAALAGLDRKIDAARGLAGLHRAWVEGWVVGSQTAVAIAGLWAAVAKAREWLGLPGRARLVTHVMMDGYRRVASLPTRQRAAGLDAWLARHGHRGPGESDVARPRFAELRDVLLADLSAQAAPMAEGRQGWWGRLVEQLFRPLYWLDECREWFRDEWMKRWQRLRGRLLEEGRRLVEAGQLDCAEDVFWLRGVDVGGAATLRDAVAAARARLEAVRAVSLPLTADLDTLTELLQRAETNRQEASGRRVFRGIGLAPVVFEGEVRLARDLVELLRDAGRLNGRTVLVVGTLEPSWAVVFPRVGAVVAEVGGELSHASILLREAGKPAVVNAAGILAAVRDGDVVRLDGRRGVVEVVERCSLQGIPS